MRIADLQVILRDGVVVARVSGEVDLSNSSDLRAAITEATPNDAMGVVLDMSDVSYVDSAGIHMLYRLGENLRNRGQTLRVVIPPASPASDSLRLAGIKRHVDAVEELEEAVRAIETSGKSQ